MVNKKYNEVQRWIMVALCSALFLFPGVAHSKDSCNKFAGWVKPLQAFAIEDRRGNLRMAPIRKPSEAYEEYKILFEDENFTPFFGKPFDSLNGFTRSGINRALQYAGNRCGKRDETDIKFYVSLSPGVYLSEPFSNRATRGPDMSYEAIVAHVQQVRSTGGSMISKPNTDKKSALSASTTSAAASHQADNKQTINAMDPISPMSLSGSWTVVSMYDMKKFHRVLERRISDFEFRFENINARTIRITRSHRKNTKESASTDLKLGPSKRGFTLTMKSNSVQARNGFSFYSLAPLRSKNGVDILKSSNDGYYIRFRETDSARDAGFSEMDFYSFCAGPAASMVLDAQKEFNYLEKLASPHPIFYKRYDKRLVAALGLFGSKHLESTFGKRYLDFSKQAQVEFVERLRACAIFHPNRQKADLIATALFGNSFTMFTVKRDADIQTGKKQKALEVYTNASEASNLLRNVEQKRESLNSAVAEIDRSRLGADKRIEKLAAVYDENVYHLPPSEKVTELSTLATSLAELQNRRQIEREEELDRTGPARSQGDLVAGATRKYFLQNCSKAVLSLKAGEKGRGLGAILSARSVKDIDGQCVIESATHILSFSLQGVALQSCSDEDLAVCSFQAYWLCSYKLNPKFGFSKGTANIDPVCPLVRNSPTDMIGRYTRKSQRRWIAQQISW